MVGLTAMRFAVTVIVPLTILLVLLLLCIAHTPSISWLMGKEKFVNFPHSGVHTAH
jgi:hypothetical protein